MSWPQTATLERSRARWVPQARIRRGATCPEPCAVLPLPGPACAACGSPTVADLSRMDALFRHGGYGATLRTVRRFCPACGWAVVAEQSEERPPR